MSLKSKLRQFAIILNGSFRRDRRSRVIFYHDVTGQTQYTDMATPISRFMAHVKTIRQLGFGIVDKISAPYNQIQICFDDGFRGIWDCRQFFIDNDLHPTIFISDSLLGQPGYLTIDEVKELHQLGFLFEGHTRSHTNLTLFSEQELRKELTESLNYLRQVTGLPISDLCFPQGFYSDSVAKIAIECGYQKLYTSDPAPYSENLVPRYLMQDAPVSVVRSTLFGGQDFLFSHYRNYHKQK